MAWVAAAAVIIAAAGAAYGAYAANEQADAQASAAKEQAKTENANAAIEAANRRKELQRALAAQDALRAARGTSLTSGTALSIYSDTVKQGENDVSLGRLNSGLQAWRYRAAADQARQQGTDAAVSAGLSGTSSAISGGYSIYKKS